MDIFLVLVGAMVALVLIGLLGLKIQPAPFPPFAQRQSVLETRPLPAGLPPPVERFYRTLYGERVPVITSAVLTGRAAMRPFGPLAFPARFRFTHQAGQGYRHYFELTWFGIPIMKGDEHFLEGRGRLELPMGITQGEHTDQGANLALWAESIWLSPIYLTDPRVRWGPVDDVTALLAVPFGDATERFVVRFDAETGLVTWLESMRYQDETSPLKTLWLNQMIKWSKLDGQLTNTTGAVIWMDDGKPWLVVQLEDAVFNVDVREYIKHNGA